MIQKIWQNKARVVLLVGCAGVVVVLFLYLFGLYPLAVVNGHVITAKRFQSASAVASFYYGNLLKAYNQEKNDQVGINQTELQSEILTSLIENELITEKLNADLGGELQYLINEKLGVAGDSPDLKKNVAMLYGMNWDDFKREILVSQAMKDILADQLFLKKEKAGDWLDRAEKSANVIIFSLKFKWDGSRVIVGK